MIPPRPVALHALVPLLLLLPIAVAAADGGAPIDPRPRGDGLPDHPWDIQKLTLDVTVDPALGCVEGTATYVVAPLVPGTQPFVLDAVALDIVSVTVNGAPLPWRVEPDRIVLDLPALEVPAGAFHEVTVTYSATPRTGLHFRRAEEGSPDRYLEVWSQGEGTDNRYWFPCYDHPNDRFLYEGKVHGPDGLSVHTNSGVDLVSYLVMLVAGPYVTFGDDLNSVWAPPGTPRNALVPILDPIPRMQEWFRQRTGVAYPWGSYRQIFVQRFLYSGMENTSATIEATALLTGPVNQATRPGIEYVIGHELAHQWYGDLLTSRDWHHLWLNEGFSTFMAYDWLAYGRDVANAYAWAESVRGWYDAASGGGSLTGAWFLGPDTPENTQVYVKGAAVLAMLRVHLGEDTFWRGVTRYTQAHQRGLVVTSDLQRAMEDVSGQNLGWFFQQWTELPAIPKLESSWSWSPPDQLTIELGQGIDATHPRYTLPVGIEIGPGGTGPSGVSATSEAPTPRFERVWMDQARLTVRLTLTTPPAWVAIDPHGGLLVEHTDKQTATQWAAQALHSPSAYARLGAVRTLGTQTGSGVAEAETTLVTLLGNPQEPPEVRRAAAAALGELRAADPLLARLGEPDPRLRLAVATALAKAARPQDADVLANARGSEPTADGRAALHRAIAQADAERAMRTSRQVLRATPAVPGVDAGTHEVEVGAAIDILGAYGDTNDLPLLLATPVARGRRAGGLHAASQIVGRLALGPDREAARRTVARSAEALLDDLDLRGRETAVAVLATVGDADSLVRLERFRREEEVVTLLADVTTMMSTIRARQDAVTPPTPNEVDARLKALEQRLQTIEERQRTWEAH